MSQPAVEWTAVVVTCQTRDTAFAIQHELHQRQELGIIPDGAVVIAVEDPEARVGSGGATLNALLVVAEHISAKKNFSGRQYSYEACGRGFLSLPFKLPNADNCATVTCNLDVLYYLMTYKIARGMTSGVWVCSTDMLLSLPSDIGTFSYDGVDVCVISVPSDVDYATRHGVYRLTNTDEVCDILYQGTREEVQRCVSSGTDTVPLVAGVVYINSKVAEVMLGFHTSPPLDACTYVGIDSGSEPIQLSLFFDLLLAMCRDVSEQDFVSGLRSGSYGRQCVRQETSMRQAREQIWKALRQYKIQINLIPKGRHLYVEEHQNTLVDLLKEYRSVLCLPTDNRLHAFVKPDTHTGDDISIQNSYLDSQCIIGRGCLISHCYLASHTTVGDNCILKGIHIKDMLLSSLNIRNNSVLIGIHIQNCGLSASGFVYVTWGLRDDLTKVIQKSSGTQQTFCNIPLETFFEETGICWHDLWDQSLSDSAQTLYTAKLFPVYTSEHSQNISDITWLQCSTGSMDQQIFARWRASVRVSLSDVFQSVDYGAEFEARRSLFHTVSLQMMADTLLSGSDAGLNKLYKTAVSDKVAPLYLAELDHVASCCSRASVAARTLANIADVLGNMARNKGGLRSGPAGNKQWATAFNLLEKGDIPRGVEMLSKERHNWLSQPELLIRAARHYEGAAQILIRQAVMSAKQFIQTVPCDLPSVGQWVKASCPARIDIAGGWSDTPPITYEHGGAVINAAITIDGQRPIGAKARRIKELHIVLSIVNCGHVVWTTTITDISQLADYNNPHAPGALLKAVLHCTNIVSYPSQQSLQDQLAHRYGSGFELESSSNLKHGSGLGTSSILAGVLMAVLWRASGHKCDASSLNHAVSYLEQVMTTGGGWQDTVGGLMGSIKVGHSEAKLPLKIETTYPQIAEETIREFNERLVLVYTGKTRLARNLLQNVLRNWFARDSHIVRVIDDLVDLAWRCAKAFQEGDLAAVGRCMNAYWDLKKQIAPSCEPAAVAEMMDVLRPHAFGLCLAGAGGGGYMYVLMKEGRAISKVKDVLSTVKEIPNISIHDCAVDMLGLQIEVER